MKKFVVIIGIIVAVIALSFIGLRIYTKSFSPQDTVTYDKQGLTMSLAYSRPYRNDRVVFGGLVPYEEVWRTGANEATVFTTNAPLRIVDKVLPAGSYSIFTIPGPEEWEVIFNSETGQWGISLFGGQANRDPEKDVLSVTVPSITTSEVFEQFTMTFDDMSGEIELIMMWDQTMVVVPMTMMAD